MDTAPPALARLPMNCTRVAHTLLVCVIRKAAPFSRSSKFPADGASVQWRWQKAHTHIYIERERERERVRKKVLKKESVCNSVSAALFSEIRPRHSANHPTSILFRGLCVLEYQIVECEHAIVDKKDQGYVIAIDNARPRWAVSDDCQRAVNLRKAPERELLADAYISERAHAPNACGDQRIEIGKGVITIGDNDRRKKHRFREKERKKKRGACLFGFLLSFLFLPFLL